MTADESRWADNKVAVVTGGNRGLGLETCRQLARAGARVVLGSRDTQKGETAAAALRRERLDIAPHALDVTDPASIERLARFIERQFGRLDILVNSAGVFEDSGAEGTSALRSDPAIVRRTFETNTLGPLMVSQALIPLMQGKGRVVNVSSGMGQLAEMNGGYPGYRLSKAALNALTRILADELKGTGIKVNSVCPGWVKTDMGGPTHHARPNRASRRSSGSPPCPTTVRTAASSATSSRFHGEPDEWWSSGTVSARRFSRPLSLVRPDGNETEQEHAAAATGDRRG